MGINTAYNRVATSNTTPFISTPTEEPKKTETSSSWNKPLLYTAFTIAAVAAVAFGAYQFGMLPSSSTQPNPPPPPTPSWKEKVEIPKQIRHQILAEKQRSEDLIQENKPVLMLGSGQPTQSTVKSDPIKDSSAPSNPLDLADTGNSGRGDTYPPAGSVDQPKSQTGSGTSNPVTDTSGLDINFPPMISVPDHQDIGSICLLTSNQTLTTNAWAQTSAADTRLTKTAERLLQNLPHITAHDRSSQLPETTDSHQNPPVALQESGQEVTTQENRVSSWKEKVVIPKPKQIRYQILVNNQCSSDPFQEMSPILMQESGIRK